MTDEELRALVRETVARHLGGSASASSPRVIVVSPPHPSMLRFKLPSGRDGDGPCLIESAVPCSHCGFCQSLGH